MANVPLGLITGGGYGSQDCTATIDDVSMNKTYIGADTEDQVWVGGLVDYQSTDAIEGTASMNANSVRLASPRPCIMRRDAKFYASYNAMASTIGVTPAKLMPDVTILGVSSNNQKFTGGSYTPGDNPITLQTNGKIINGNITINRVDPNVYFKYGGTGTVFNNGSYGNLAPLGAYYTESYNPPIAINPVIISGGAMISNITHGYAPRLIFTRNLISGKFRRIEVTAQATDYGYQNLVIYAMTRNPTSEGRFVIAGYIETGVLPASTPMKLTIDLRSVTNQNDYILVFNANQRENYRVLKIETFTN